MKAFCSRNVLLATGWCVVSILSGGTSLWGQTDSLDLLEERAFKEALVQAEPSIVRIETVGGLDQVGQMTLGTGPTTGVVVSEDGYIVSSSFNFIGNPSSILVTFANEKRYPAKVIAQDRLRMITLLKIDATGLSPARPAQKKEVKVGQWAIAIGRTYDLAVPNLSVGIISAVERVWGKAVQTDAKVSPVNYGGPLVNIEGKTIGILVPMSPDGKNESAGVEWYDGGIGFAVPLEDIYSVLDRLKTGKDLKPGLLGVTFKKTGMSMEDQVIDNVRFGSPASKGGLKKGDALVEIDGRTINQLAHVRYALGQKAAGDTIDVKYKRGTDVNSTQITLVDELLPFEEPFLGVLPKRKALGEGITGVGIRAIIEGSGAEKAGLKPGERITHVADTPVKNAGDILTALRELRPGDSIKLKVEKGTDSREVTVTTSTIPNTVPGDVPSEMIVETSEFADPKPKVGRLNDVLADHGNRAFWSLVPENYHPQGSYGLIVWLHPQGDTMEATITRAWQAECERRGMIMIGPKSEKVSDWTPNDVEFVQACVTRTRENYSVSADRIVVMGHASSARMAAHLAFQARDVYRGLVVTNGVLAGQLPSVDPEHRLQIYVGFQSKSKSFRSVEQGVEALRKAKFPAAFRDLAGENATYPTADEVKEIARWVDALDRF